MANKNKPPKIKHTKEYEELLYIKKRIEEMQQQLELAKEQAIEIDKNKSIIEK